MNEIIPCDIIQDLLPLYVDGLTRETTSRELEMHLARCSRCRECFERMRRGIEEEKSLQQQEAYRDRENPGDQENHKKGQKYQPFPVNIPAV